MKNISQQSGYAAIATVLVIGATITVIVISTSLLSISEAQQSLAEKKAKESLYLAESCVQEALLQIYLDETYNGGIVTLQTGECTVTTAKNNSLWQVQAEASVLGYSKKIQVEIDRSPPAISIVSWKQI